MNYKQYNDYELIYMVRENDDDSYDVLFQKYIPIIKKIAMNYYQNYSSYGYDLDDFIQEGYLAFQSAVLHYNENKDALFYTFLVLCLHRCFISFCKKISCDKKNINQDYLIPIDSVFLADDYSLENSLFNNELIHMIWDIVYSNPFESICVFELRWNHFTYHEIQILLGISPRKSQRIYHNLLFSIQNKLRTSL